MSTHGINHINLYAQRALLDALRDFYCDVVGLQPGPRPPFAFFGYWLYADGRAVVHLVEAAPGDPRPPHVTGTFDHVAFDCTGRAAVEALLHQRGVPFRTAVVPALNQVQLFVRDPAGNGVELNFAHADA